MNIEPKSPLDYGYWDKRFLDSLGIPDPVSPPPDGWRFEENYMTRVRTMHVDDVERFLERILNN